MTIPSPRIRFEGCPLCVCPRTSVLRVAACDWHANYVDGLGDTMRWLRCDDCGHVFVDGYFTDAALDLLFGRTHEAQRPGADLEPQRQVWAQTVDRVVRRLDGPPRTWLDVGFGNGVLLLTAAEWGFRPVGLDLRPDTVFQMQALGVECHLQDVAEYVPDEPVQVVSMCDVLEHIPYPRPALEQVRKVMADDGVLVLSMPSFDSPAWHLLDRAGTNPYWGELEHYHNFSRQRLAQLLEETGFEYLEYGVSPRWRITMEVLARPR